MSSVRLGIIGTGGMGGAHIQSVLTGKVTRAQVTAIADLDAKNLAKHPTITGFTDANELFRSGLCDAVLIATPHFLHTTQGIAALGAGLHVLVEKPLSVHKADCERLIAAYDRRPEPRQVFAAMFNQRTDPRYKKVKDWITSGELGEVRRINWIITDWFRSEAYYASGGWRATWKGEGGGVLINQCPHNLDLMQWLFGMPTAVRAFCRFGKWHRIEVEDDVTAHLTFANGASGVFITSTGEAPGTNRLEIAAERGRVVIEGDSITFDRNRVPMSEYSQTTGDRFGRPESWHISVPVANRGGQHVEVVQNFVDAILDGVPLIAPAVEGIRSVELGNAMILSTLTERTVDLPMDGAEYERHLQRLIAESTFVKQVRAATAGEDFAKSHTK